MLFTILISIQLPMFVWSKQINRFGKASHLVRNWCFAFTDKREQQKKQEPFGISSNFLLLFRIHFLWFILNAHQLNTKRQSINSFTEKPHLCVHWLATDKYFKEWKRIETEYIQLNTMNIKQRKRAPSRKNGHQQKCQLFNSTFIFRFSCAKKWRRPNCGHLHDFSPRQQRGKKSRISWNFLSKLILKPFD